MKHYFDGNQSMDLYQIIEQMSEMVQKKND